MFDVWSLSGESCATLLEADEEARFSLRWILATCFMIATLISSDWEDDFLERAQREERDVIEGIIFSVS
jgi:hypothetical protein